MLRPNWSAVAWHKGVALQRSVGDGIRSHIISNALQFALTGGLQDMNGSVGGMLPKEGIGGGGAFIDVRDQIVGSSSQRVYRFRTFRFFEVVR